MCRRVWRYYLTPLWKKCSFYSTYQPLPFTRSFWLAFACANMAVISFCIYFIVLTTLKQDAFLTNGQDLGIMDQAIWSVWHGPALHQTICNSVTDTNCAGLEGISRFSIHFEPILFPIALVYLLWPDPKALLVIQVLIVASGAFPAFWLARLRLRHEFIALTFAFLYLLYPSLQYAVNFDFHAVTLTSAFIMFMLYFLYGGQHGWVFVFALLSMACKEEIAGVIAGIGLWSVLFQHRWRSGLALIALAISWTGLGLVIVHIFSPIGHSLLTSRFEQLGDSPADVILTLLRNPFAFVQRYVFEPAHALYLRKLLVPAGYLPLLAPWILVLASPTLLLNLVSSDPNMYSGQFQYNAEVIPILIFATIEAIVFLLKLLRLMKVYIQRWMKRGRSSHRYKLSLSTKGYGSVMRMGVHIFFFCSLLFSVLRVDASYNVYSAMPFAMGFIWPRVSTHARMAYQFINQIPRSASVSTQTALVPHMSQRSAIYLFPYAIDDVDYILLDVKGYSYPFHTTASYKSAVKGVLQGGNYGVQDAQDGYILLKQGLTPTHIDQALQILETSNPKGSVRGKMLVNNPRVSRLARGGSSGSSGCPPAVAAQVSSRQRPGVTRMINWKPVIRPSMRGPGILV